MPKVLTSPAPIARRNFSRAEYIISYKQPPSIRSKPFLLLQHQRKRPSRSHHGGAALSLPHSSALITDSAFLHSFLQSDIPLTITSVWAEHANASRGDTDPNPHEWSPIVLRKGKQNPAPIPFQLLSRKTSFQKQEQAITLQPPPGEDKAFLDPPFNEVTHHQQPRPQSDTAALREWIARIIFGFAMLSDQPRLPVCSKAVAMVAANIKRLFRLYPLPYDVVFLALWYASHIMPDGLLDHFDLYQPDGIVLVTRLFVLSYTLAVKWLADENYALGKWVPHYQKGFSNSSARALDKAALRLLDYNLYISPSQWTAWLHKLDERPSTNVFMEDRVHLVAQARIRKLLSKSETPSLSSRPRSMSTSVTAIWHVHKILLENLAISIPLPEPAPWNPAEDPIIHTTGRRHPIIQSPFPWSYGGNHCWVPHQPDEPPITAFGLSFLDQRGSKATELTSSSTCNYADHHFCIKSTCSNTSPTSEHRSALPIPE